MEKKKHECCTPEGQIPRYVDCVGCDKKPMENKKQSSVEWFAMMLAEQGLLVTKDYENLVTYKEAKSMHKEEIVDARQSGIDATINGRSISNIDYYNETFGGQDNG